MVIPDHSKLAPVDSLIKKFEANPDENPGQAQPRTRSRSPVGRLSHSYGSVSKTEEKGEQETTTIASEEHTEVKQDELSGENKKEEGVNVFEKEKEQDIVNVTINEGSEEHKETTIETVEHVMDEVVQEVHSEENKEHDATSVVTQDAKTQDEAKA